MIGNLLDHTKVEITARYTHLANATIEASGPPVGNSISMHNSPPEPA